MHNPLRTEADVFRLLVVLVGAAALVVALTLITSPIWGIQLAVASSSPRRWLDLHLGRAGLLGQFDVIAAGDEVSRPKPHPDVYQLALRRLGAAPDQSVAVEDTPHGVRAAHAAGLACIAIPNPYVPPAAVASAELVLASASAMPLRDALEHCQRERKRGPDGP